MATAIPSANIKAFPSANDINAGSTGAGNIVTEENLNSLLGSIPSRNFIISGFAVSFNSTTTVSITQGEAFVNGHYLKTNATITYTIGTVPTSAKAFYFYLTATFDGGGNVSGAQFEDEMVTVGAQAPDPGSSRVFIGIALTNSGGELVDGQVGSQKDSFGGGVVTGSYLGTGDGSADIQDLTVTLGFSPSFVYVVGQQGSGSNIVACSGSFTPGNKPVISSPLVGGFESCGWCLVSSSTINTHPKFYTGTATWTGGSIFENAWKTQDVTIGGVRRGDLVTIGGDNFFDGAAASNTLSTESILRDINGSQVWYAVPVAPGYMNKDDSEVGYIFGSGALIDSTNRLLIGAYASADDTVKWVMYNCDSGERTPNASATASFVVQSAWEMQTSTQTFLYTGALADQQFCPQVTETGFTVRRTDEGVASSGETLNTSGRRYFYWAFA